MKKHTIFIMIGTIVLAGCMALAAVILYNSNPRKIISQKYGITLPANAQIVHYYYKPRQEDFLLTKIKLIDSDTTNIKKQLQKNYFTTKDMYEGYVFQNDVNWWDLEQADVDEGFFIGFGVQINPTTTTDGVRYAWITKSANGYCYLYLYQCY